jgi:sulfatase modifying factor 1
MHNNQPGSTGLIANPRTEQGAYDFSAKAAFPQKSANAKFWIPSENEWYKAAYYNPSNKTYWYFPTRSNTLPQVAADPLPAAAANTDTNTANYNAIVNNNKLAKAGNYSNSKSAYGIKDMAGSLWEWSDGLLNGPNGTPETRAVRGGSWSLGFLNPSKTVRRDYTPDETDDDTGFRLASNQPANVTAPASTNPAQNQSKGAPNTNAAGVSAVNTFKPTLFSPSAGQNLIDMVSVGNPNNPADKSGYGKVGYTYRIGKNEVTVAQYLKFLNAVASDPKETRQGIKDLWQDDMADPTEKPGALITRANDTVTGKYVYKAPTDAKGKPLAVDTLPIAWTNWFSAARFANWLHNDPSKPVTANTTEIGAYNLKNATTGVFERQPGAKFWIPSEDEWYKAAYYDPTKTTQGGYWKYATKSDRLPSDKVDDFANSNAANYNDQRKKFNVFTPVGSYSKSPSHYGTYDMTGNVWEWNDGILKSPTKGTPDSRIVRGGSFAKGLIAIESATRRDYPAGYRAANGYLAYTDDDTGFRIAGAPLLGSTPV